MNLALLKEITGLFSPLGGLVFVCLFWVQSRADQAGAFWMVLARLPSTICHETMHLLVSLLTFAKPTGFSILPHRVADGWSLGSVTCSNLGTWSAFPVAMAPLLNVVPAYYFLSRQKEYGVGYTVAGFVLLAASIPSWADFCVMSRYPASVSLWTAALGGIWAGTHSK